MKSWPLSLKIGGFITLFFCLIAVLATMWVPYDSNTLSIATRLQPPSVAHWLGTDHFGRDILSMLMAGARISIGVAMMAVLIGAGFGIPVGLLAASRHQSWLDDLLMRGSDLIFAFPALLMAILLTASLGPGVVNAMLAIGLFNIPVFARITRAAALSQWQQDFIAAARLAGKSNRQISYQHILPNIQAVLIIQISVQISLGILAEAGLSYVGLGAQPPLASWGRMLADSQTFISLAPHIALFPGLTICLAVLGLNLLGDGLRDYSEQPQHSLPAQAGEGSL